RLFHRKYGFNLVMPTLPLHGPRKIGRFSGDGFMSGDVLDSIHGETQGLWDIRRILSWVRAQEAPSIGVYGLSLGGYTASMLTGIETGLDFVIAGIPMTSLSATYWDHLPDHVVRMYLESGLNLERLEQVTQVVSPIHVAPKVPKEGRAIFGGVGDRLVSADQVVTLARHWEEPATAWYQGSHMTFLFDPTVRELIENTVRRSAAPAAAGAA
ncbi:MAG: alpha/beta hydrolase, partial [bacterium]|nr:alpha/beta hydrolase [bacterium]